MTDYNGYAVFGIVFVWVVLFALIVQVSEYIERNRGGKR